MKSEMEVLLFRGNIGKLQKLIKILQNLLNDKISAEEDFKAYRAR